MRYIKGISSYQWGKSTAVTLGKFDGLHRGHQMLVDKIREYGVNGCESVLCAFDMQRDCLMTKDERRRHLEGKIDYLVEYPFTDELREMQAEDFIQKILKDTLHASHIVVGTDFSFGYQKRGNIEMLRKFADQCGYTLDVIEKKKYQGRIISSSYVREALTQGNVKLAENLLGYPYEMTGIVEDEHKRLLEVFVYGYEGDAYGQEITAQFLEFERPETKFGSVEELKEQVMRDMKFGETYFESGEKR